VSWEKEETEKGWTRREWVKLGMTAGAIGTIGGLGGLVTGQILPPPYKFTGEIRETIHYTKFPTRQWWNARAGTPVRAGDFQEWQGATGVWKGLFQDGTYVPGTGLPCLIIRVKRETGPNPFFSVPPDDQLPANFKQLQATDSAFNLYFDDETLDPGNGGTRIVVLFDRCVHLCCYPGWHVVDNPPPDYSNYLVPAPTHTVYGKDPIYCVCHGSQYDPMLLVVNVNNKNGEPYVGAERVHGPAPRALAVIPLKRQGVNLVGGMPLDPGSGLPDPSWYVYC